MPQIFSDMPMLKFVVAFAIVLGLIALTAWILRRISSNRLGGSARGRQPRLAVIDAASVDGRRRLVLIRRDNVEHLMMIGGPNDLVVEPNIVRASAARDAGREAFRSTPPEARQDMRQEMRPAPIGDSNGNWPLQPAVEPPAPAPMPSPAPRSYRPPVSEEPWVAAESAVPPAPPPRDPGLRARPTDSITGNITNMAAEFNARLSPELDLPPAPPPPPRPAPMREPPAAATPAPSAPPPLPPHTDKNLAEMAQRLEAALRRPSAHQDVHPPVTDPLAAPMASKETTMKPPEPMREPRMESRMEPRAEPKLDIAAEPKSEPKPDAKPAAAKNPFDSLEAEMASLLGRQSGKT
jgi:hypothetical protein